MNEFICRLIVIYQAITSVVFAFECTTHYNIQRRTFERQLSFVGVPTLHHNHHIKVRQVDHTSVIRTPSWLDHSATTNDDDLVDDDDSTANPSDPKSSIERMASFLTLRIGRSVLKNAQQKMLSKKDNDGETVTTQSDIEQLVRERIRSENDDENKKKISMDALSTTDSTTATTAAVIEPMEIKGGVDLISLSEESKKDDEIMRETNTNNPNTDVEKTETQQVTTLFADKKDSDKDDTIDGDDSTIISFESSGDDEEVDPKSLEETTIPTNSSLGEKTVSLHEKEGDRIITLKDEFNARIDGDDVINAEDTMLGDNDNSDALVAPTVSSTSEFDKSVLLDKEKSTSLHEKEGDRIVALKDEFAPDEETFDETITNNNVDSSTVHPPLPVIDAIDELKTTTSTTSVNVVIGDDDTTEPSSYQKFVPPIPEVISLGFGRALPVITSEIPSTEQ